MKSNLYSTSAANRLARVVSLPLLIAVWCSALPVHATLQTRARTTTQQPQSKRSEKSSVTASPTPTPPAATTPTPAPTPAEVQDRGAANAKSIEELQARITEILDKPELSQAMVGIKVASLDTGRLLFEQNSNKLLRPASNMKLYTVAAALDRLKPDYRFVTSVYAPARPDANGVVHGDLIIYGRGDPSMATRFNNGDYFKSLDELAGRIIAAGVKRVEGDLVGDESHFTGPQYGSGWEWEDLTWYYGAEISALTINDNALDLFVRPGVEVGSKASVSTGPPDPLLTIVNQVTTSAKGTKRNLTVDRGLGEDTITVSGTIAQDDRGFSVAIGISHPALLFVYLLRAALAQKGVTITGRSRTNGTVNQTLLTAGATVTSSTTGNGSTSKADEVRTEIATMQSPPLSIIAAQTLKPSQNLYTELILRTLGKVVPLPANLPEPPETSEAAGLEIVKAFLKDSGILPETLVLTDGSGLSRNDMITAEATVQLLTYMSRHPQFEVFKAALPIAGVDGTLRNRMKGTVAENNLRAKTGSLSSAASLSGYVTTRAGERLVFSIIVNNYGTEVEPRVICIDPIAVLLASFSGKS